MITRRTFTSLAIPAVSAVLSGARAQAALDPQYRLIAHRGGIVDEQHAENSPGYLQAAIDRGYWMIEMDIRRTKDGEPILQHDPNFRRFYNDERTVDQVTWSEAGRLRAKPGGTSPIHFRDVCRMCQGKIRVMLDIKGANFPDEFYANLRKLLADHSLLDTAYMLTGGPIAAKHLAPYCSISCKRDSLRAAIARGEDVKSRYFLFEPAAELNEESFELSRHAGVPAVASLATFRYTMAKRDEWKGPEEDCAKMKKLGVRNFLLDSRHEAFFRV
jgi:glycerophosphoryl diester phosphodiesterase